MKLMVAVLFLLFFSHLGFGQEITNLVFKVDKLTIKEKVFTGTSDYSRQKEKAIVQFALNGYTGIALKDSSIDKSTITYNYTYAQKINKIILVDSANEKSTAIKNYTAALSELNATLKRLENNGFPFAQVKVLTEEIQENKLVLNYKVDSGELFLIDEIIIKSQKKFNENTILNLINLQAGDLYNEQKIRRIEANLINSGFYKLLQPTQILFTPGKASVYLFIEALKSSTADGYVGLQQNQLTGKINLNGYINLSLNNAFKRAAKINLNWRNNPDKTQLLNSNFDFPFLFNTPLGVGSKLDLQKQDTSFIRSDVQFYLSYRNPIFTTKIFTAFQQSSLLGNDIPNFRSFSKTTIGTGLTYNPLMNDNFAFYKPSIALEAGFFTYRRDTIQDLVESPLNFSISAKYGQKIKFLKYFSLNNSLSIQNIISPTQLARNELVYFGGLRTLRGFYELELTGNEVWILSNEVVFKPVSAFELKLIYDYSHFVYNGANYTHSGGIGFGLNTGNNQLEIVIANGTLNNNPFLLTNTKVHLGFKSNF